MTSNFFSFENTNPCIGTNKNQMNTNDGLALSLLCYRPSSSLSEG